MSSYQPPYPLPLPPSFNALYFEARGFITLSQATELFLPKINPNVAGNLSVAGTTTLTNTNLNGNLVVNSPSTATFSGQANANSGLRVGSSGSVIQGLYTGQTGNLNLPATGVTSFSVSFGQTITGTKRIFPSVVLISGTGNKQFITQILQITNTDFILEIHNDSPNANTIQIAWMLIVV